jgi:hypothetical protein
MANNVSTQKLVNELDKAVDEAKKLLKVFNDTEKVTKDMAEQLKEAFKGIDKNTSKGLLAFNKAIKETNKLTEDSEKLEQAQIKTKIQLHKLEQERNKTLIQVAKERERQRVLFNKENKNNKKELDAYQKKSRALNENRKAYKALAAEQKGTTAEGKKLLKSITALDKELKEIDETVGQNQRSVGKYQDAVKGLNSTIGKLGIAAVIAKGVELLGSAFGSSREGALSMEIQIAKVTETVKVFVNSVIDAFPAVLDLFGSIGDSFSLVGKKAERAFLEVQDFVNGSSEVTANLAKVNAEIAVLEASSADEAIERIKKAFEGNVDATSKAITAQEKYLKLQLATKISISEQEKALAGLQEQRQILQDQSDDDTIGFVTRAKFVKEAEEIAIKFEKQQVQLAKTKEKLALEAVKQDLRRAKISVKGIETAEQLIALIEKGNNAKKISDTNDEAFTAAYTERREAEVESESFKRDQEEKFRKTARDAFEQELDVLEEFTEKKVASNALIIADDTKTLEERQAAADENVRLTELLFKNSVELIIAQGKASIDLRADLSEAEKQTQKDMLTNIKLQEILNTQDATKIFNLLRELDLGEIEEKRGKDTLKIKKDLIAVNKESAKVEEEALLKTKELQEDILLQQQKLNGEDVDLEKERTKKLKKNLQERIDLLEEDSIARLELEKELNELLLEDQEKTQEKTKELLEKGTEVFEEILANSREKQNAELDAELDALDDRISDVQKAISEGSPEAKQSLAELEAQKLEAEKKKEELRKKEIRDAKLIAGLQLLASNDGNVGKTLGDVSLLIAALNTLPSFFEGTEDTGTVNKPLDSNGGRTVLLHDNERVMTAKQNAKLGGISNEDLADLGAMHKSGTLNGGTTIIQANNQELLQEVREMTKAIKNQPTQNYNYDAKAKYHEQVITSKNKREIIKSKANNLFK